MYSGFEGSRSNRLYGLCMRVDDNDDTAWVCDITAPPLSVGGARDLSRYFEKIGEGCADICLVCRLRFKPLFDYIKSIQHAQGPY